MAKNASETLISSRNLEVGPADPGPADTNEGFTGFRHGELHVIYMQLPVKDQCSHCAGRFRVPPAYLKASYGTTSTGVPIGVQKYSDTMGPRGVLMQPCEPP